MEDGRKHGERTERLERLFTEFLEAGEAGRDIAAELLERAGELRADLEAKISLERELRALSRELGMGSKSPGAPQLLGRFNILGTLGQGGISRVYLAYDPKLDRRIALKVLDRESLLDKHQRYWILNEARSLARIRHRGVVEVYEVGETEAHAFVAMELLPGPSLHEVLRELARRRDGGPGEDVPTAVRDAADRLAPVEARIELLARLAEALAQCHDHGILHRDIKPHNVLFDAEGQPKLIDFGLAHVEGADEDSRLGLTQAMVGTAAYSAPEQVASDQTGADPRSDQFSFGTLAYECLALENPFQRKTRRATLDAIETADPPALRARAPDVPPDLARVIHHALACASGERYASMAALGVDLRAVLAHRPVSVEDPSLAKVARLWLRRHRRGAAIGGSALALGLFLAASSWWIVTRDEHARLRRALADIRPEEFTRPEEFESSFRPLLELRQQISDFDESGLRVLLIGELGPEASAKVHAWAAHLGQSYARDLAENLSSGRPIREHQYRRLFALEEVLCEECTENLEYRLRGTTRFPVERLAEYEYAFDQLVTGMVSNDSYSYFLPATMEKYLVPGTYRLQVWRSAEALEFESLFLVGGWAPEIVVELVPPDPELWREAVPFELEPHPLPMSGEPLLVPAFRLLPRLVTFGEVLAFGRSGGQVGQCVNDPGSPSEAPALVDLATAEAYVRHKGGRLPFAAELLRASDAGVVALAPAGAVAGEYVLDLHHEEPSELHWLDYGTLGQEDPGGRLMLAPDRNRASGTFRGSEASHATVQWVAFRIVFSADRPDTYRELTRSPFDAVGLEPGPRQR